MNNRIRVLITLLLIFFFVFAFRKSAQINTLKNKVPQNSPVKEQLFAVSDHIGENGSGITLKEEFPDLQVTGFDPTGVGSGPIDYLYSKKADTTFFYSRYFDSIISFQAGRIVYSPGKKTAYN